MAVTWEIAAVIILEGFRLLSIQVTSEQKGEMPLGSKTAWQQQQSYGHCRGQPVLASTTS